MTYNKTVHESSIVNQWHSLNKKQSQSTCSFFYLKVTRLKPLRKSL